MNEPKWTTHRVTMPEDMALDYLERLLPIVNKEFLDPGYPIALSMAIDKIRAPLPDNKALAAEELRKMDGQPVYLTIKNGANGPLEMWALVDVVADTGAFWLRNNLGGRSCCHSDADLKNSGIVAYRRPPEKGEP